MEHLPLGIVLGLLAVAWRINLTTGLIPDRLTFPSVLAAITFSAVFPAVFGARTALEGFGYALLGAAAGLGNALLAADLAKRVWGRKRHFFSPPAEFCIIGREGKNAEIGIGGNHLVLADLFTRESDVVQIEADQVLVEAGETVCPGRSRLLTVGFGWVALDGKTYPMTPRLDVTGYLSMLDHPRDIIGMGAIKAMMIPGAFLGWKAALFSFWGAALLLSAKSLIQLSLRRPFARTFQAEPYVIAALLVWAWLTT